MSAQSCFLNGTMSVSLLEGLRPVLLAHLSPVFLDLSNRIPAWLTPQALVSTGPEQRWSKPRGWLSDFPSESFLPFFRDGHLLLSSQKIERKRVRERKLYRTETTSLSSLASLLVRSFILSWKLHPQDFILNITTSQKPYSCCHSRV